MTRQINLASVRSLGDEYGIRIDGFRHVFFIAPHCAEDHEEEVNGLVARVCAATGSSAIINTEIPRRVIDLNNHQELIQVRGGAPRKFLSDIMTKAIEIMHQHDQVIIVFVHFSPRKYYRRKSLYVLDDNRSLVIAKAGEPRSFDVDIGCGLTEFCHDLVKAKTINPRRGRGEATCDVTLAWQVKRSFMNQSLNAQIGHEWAALSTKNMVQAVHRILKIDSVFQLEIIQDFGNTAAVFDALVDMCNISRK